MNGVLLLLLGVAAVVALGSASSRGSQGPAASECTSSGSLVVDGRSIRYVMHMVGGATAAQNVPVLVFFHSRGNAPEAYLKYVERIRVPARVVLPAGPLDNGRSWYNAKAADADQAKLAAQMAWTGSLVEGFLAALKACVPGRRVDAVSGFSQGASLAFLLASRRAAPSVGVSGWLPASLWSASMRKTVAIHGFTDNVVPYAPTALWAAEMLAAGAELELIGVEGGHVSDAMVDLWVGEVTEMLS